MDCRNRFDDLEPYAVEQIRYHARRLAGHHGFSKSDLPDIEQDLALDLVARLPKFDATKSSLDTFCATVIENKVASMLAYQYAARRDPRRLEGSLNDEVKDEQGRKVERWTILDQNIYMAMTADEVKFRIDLTIDVTALMRELPVELAQLASLLSDRGLSVTEASRAVGVPRGTAYEMIGKLRAAMTAAGLEEYLKILPTNDNEPQ